MAGDGESWVDLIKRELTAYLLWFANSLTSPTRISEEAAEPSTRLSLFLLASAFIGALIGSAVPGRPPLKDRAVVAASVIILWLFTSLFVHVFCRLFRGKGTLKATIMTMLQVLAIVYVTTNFAMFILTGLARAYPPIGEQMKSWGYSSPGAILLLLQFVMVALYVPLAVGSAHGFNRVLRALVGLAAASCAFVMGLAVYAQGGC